MIAVVAYNELAVMLPPLAVFCIHVLAASPTSSTTSTVAAYTPHPPSSTRSATRATRVSGQPSPSSSTPSHPTSTTSTSPSPILTSPSSRKFQTRPTSPSSPSSPSQTASIYATATLPIFVLFTACSPSIFVAAPSPHMPSPPSRAVSPRPRLLTPPDLAPGASGCSVYTAAQTSMTTPSLRYSSSPFSLSSVCSYLLFPCPNASNSVPLDLRFTRCTPAAINACLSSLGFRASENNSLFHPAPLSLALCSLEKLVLAASDPISLYSCPPQSVFRVHIDELNHLPSRTKKTVPTASSSTSHSTIRTTSSTKDIVVFIPPLRKQAKNELFPLSSPFESPTAVPVAPASSPIDQPAHSNVVSNVSSFYENTPGSNKHCRKNILPLSAQAVRPSEGGKLDPLAIARLPPPSNILDTHTSPALSNPVVTVTRRQSASDNVEQLRRTQPVACWIGQALNNPLKVDRARLHKRGSDAVADMVHQFTSKRPKVESEFVLARTQAKVSVKSRNPFVRSVFAESSTNTFDKPRLPVQESQDEAEPDVQLRVCRSLPSVRQGTGVEGTLKPLKPITTLKPPVLPKELLPSLPKHISRPKTDLKQTRLAFGREV
ncbi:hypothetical protein L210DRAFT_2829742 [Boletus edulis BED1]|uniref:Uncharacterized protein n=1 Tax=Boletus edulis BED1 TaxID=1328754 RepID=A0AAD4GKQ3_BOLED|nr:hypothetical protein L210DRAFT_2829742 [Boletus edulis BED1]